MGTRDLVIFDVDGTLYYQTPVRVRMAWRLAWFYGPRPSRWPELGLLRDFRRAREADDSAADKDLIASLATRHRLPSAQAEAILERWLLSEPLAAIVAHADSRLLALIRQAAQSGIRVAILSDYPTEPKVAALGIDADAQFCTARPPIEARKPSPKGIKTVLKHFAVPPEKALMVGDRDSKDGASARAAGVEAVILPRTHRGRKAKLAHLRQALDLV
ncbi:MAG: HAD family hydrolase [Propionibacteriaceae bacterium]|nr:HAD family hydrolase [Propionibacteriaceae bacterium]